MKRSLIKVSLTFLLWVSASVTDAGEVIELGNAASIEFSTGNFDLETFSGTVTDVAIYINDDPICHAD